MEYANVPKLPMIKMEVNNMPSSDNSRTSPNPTVDTVMTVMYKASTHEKPSINTKPTLPTTTTPKMKESAR